MISFDTDSLAEQINEMKEEFDAKVNDINRGLVSATELVCAALEGDMKRLMRDTEVDTEKTYYHWGKGHEGRQNGVRRGTPHHPSLPGHAPAPDFGTLLQSITHDVDVDGDTVTGRAGSTITEPPYPAYLENGTSKMAPRPWAKPALDMNTEFIKQTFDEVVRG